MVACVLVVGLALVGVAKANIYGGTYDDDQCTQGTAQCLRAESGECYFGLKFTCANGEITLEQYDEDDRDCAGEPIKTGTGPEGQCARLMFSNGGVGAKYSNYECGSDCTVCIGSCGEQSGGDSSGNGGEGAVSLKVQVTFTIAVTGAPDAAAVTSLEGEIAAAIANDLGIPVADVKVTISEAAGGGAGRRLLQTNYNVAAEIATDAATAAAANTIEDKLKAPAFATAVGAAVEASTAVTATVQGSVTVGSVEKTPSAGNTPNTNTGGAAEASLLAVVAVVAAAMA